MKLVQLYCNVQIALFYFINIIVQLIIFCATCGDSYLFLSPVIYQIFVDKTFAINFQAINK